MSCLFCRIVSGEIPSDVLYEDDLVMAFRDVNPQAPVHCLVIPREHVASLAELEPRHDAMVARCIATARRLAGELGLENGFRIVVNTGTDGGQTVEHLHFHLLGGRSMGWPPG